MKTIKRSDYRRTPATTAEWLRLPLASEIDPWISAPQLILANSSDSRTCGAPGFTADRFRLPGLQIPAERILPTQ
jgi:hypothetical protein